MKINLTETKTYYINLTQHTEKNEKIVKMLGSLGFKDYERLEGVTYPENPVAGCSRAHYHSIQPDKVPFILLEDDAYLMPNGWKRDVIDVPDDADAVYLGNSTWGRMNGHNGEYIQYDVVEGYPGLLRVYNMLATHAILYLTEEYAGMIRRAAYHTGYVIEDYNDTSFAELQRYFKVYALDYPIFAQSSNDATRTTITGINHRPCMSYEPLQFYPYKIK